MVIRVLFTSSGTTRMYTLSLHDALPIYVFLNGRFDLGLGQGYVPREFTGFNIPREERSRRLREGVEIVRRAFTEDHRSEEHTSELQSLTNLVCRLLLENKNDAKST